VKDETKGKKLESLRRYGMRRRLEDWAMSRDPVFDRQLVREEVLDFCELELNRAMSLRDLVVDSVPDHVGVVRASVDGIRWYWQVVRMSGSSWGTKLELDDVLKAEEVDRLRKIRVFCDQEISRLGGKEET